MQFRVGTGFDVHALVENRSLILAGVQIPYEKGLLGHSDADVALHALMDALLVWQVCRYLTKKGCWGTAMRMWRCMH